MIFLHFATHTFPHAKHFHGCNIYICIKIVIFTCRLLLCCPYSGAFTIIYNINVCVFSSPLLRLIFLYQSYTAFFKCCGSRSGNNKWSRSASVSSCGTVQCYFFTTTESARISKTWRIIERYLYFFAALWIQQKMKEYGR